MTCNESPVVYMIRDFNIEISNLKRLRKSISYSIVECPFPRLCVYYLTFYKQSIIYILLYFIIVIEVFFYYYFFYVQFSHANVILTRDGTFIDKTFKFRHDLIAHCKVNP